MGKVNRRINSRGVTPRKSERPYPMVVGGGGGCGGGSGEGGGGVGGCLVLWRGVLVWGVEESVGFWGFGWKEAGGGGGCGGGFWGCVVVLLWVVGFIFLWGGWGVYPRGWGGRS